MIKNTLSMQLRYIIISFLFILPFTKALAQCPTVIAPSTPSTICNGASNGSVRLSSSQTGVTYTLNGGASISGTGSLLDWPNLSAGTYTVMATHNTSGCQQSMGSISVNEYAPLNIYNVGGEGDFCTNGGAPIILSGSQVGVDYKLYSDGLHAATATGNGQPLNSSWIVTGGTHTFNVVAEHKTTYCTQAMAGTPTITIKSLPTIFQVTGGGITCGNYHNANVNLHGNQQGINYQLKVDGVDVGSPKIGDGTISILTWADIATGGTYTILANNPVTGCSSLMSENAVVTEVPMPQVFTLQSPDYLCPSQGSTQVTLNNSEQGVTYRLMVNGNIHSIREGTGNPLTFSVTTPGTYEVLAIMQTDYEVCQQTMDGTVTIQNGVDPNSYTSYGGGIGCENNTEGFPIHLDGSDIGVQYQLQLDGNDIGQPINGTGGAYTWPNLLAPGIYSVTSKHIATGCPGVMYSTGSITIRSLSPVFEVTGGGSVCEENPYGVEIMLGGEFDGDEGYDYELFRDNVFLGWVQTVPHWSQTEPGNYTVVAKNRQLPSCSTTMAGSATVSSIALPTIYVANKTYDEASNEIIEYRQRRPHGMQERAI